MGLELEGDAPPEVFHHLPLPGHQGGHVYRQPLGQQPRRGHGGGLPAGLGGVQEGLGGDAPPVEAGASQLPGFRHRHPLSGLGRPDGGGIAPGASADDNQIIMVSHGRSTFPRLRSRDG